MMLNLHGVTVDVDDEMGLVIKELNRLGLKTVSCCSGHDGRKAAQLCFDVQDCTVLIDKNRVSINWMRQATGAITNSTKQDTPKKRYSVTKKESSLIGQHVHIKDLSKYAGIKYYRQQLKFFEKNPDISSFVGRTGFVVSVENNGLSPISKCTIKLDNVQKDGNSLIHHIFCDQLKVIKNKEPR